MVHLTIAHERLIENASWKASRALDGACITRDDLRQQGREMFLRILAKRDPAMTDEHFGAFAWKRVWGAMVQHCRDHWRKERSIDAMDRRPPDTRRAATSDPVRRMQLIEAFNAADRLPDLDKRAAVLLMGGMDCQDVAAELGVTPETISRVKARLRTHFRKYT